MVSHELQVRAYTKDYAFQGVVSDYRKAEATPRLHAPGDGSVTLGPDNRMLPTLATPGTRLVFLHRVDGGDWNPVLSGRVAPRQMEGVKYGRGQTFTIVDDWADICQSMVLVPDPGSGIDAQADAYYQASGPAETVVKTVIGANATRLGIPLTVPASQGLGGTMRIQVRLEPAADKLIPQAETAGVRVRVVQVGTALTLLVDVPKTWPHTVTEASGVIRDVQGSITPATVTRVIVAAGGEGASRILRLYPVEARTGLTVLEQQLGYVGEVMRDARDIPANDPNLEQQLEARATETLTEGAAKASLAYTLAEGNRLRYGVTFDVGDSLSLELVGGPSVTDRITEVTITDDGGAVRVEPKAGDWQDSQSDVIYAELAAQGRAIRALQRS